MYIKQQQKEKLTKDKKKIITKNTQSKGKGMKKSKIQSGTMTDRRQTDTYRAIEGKKVF